MNISDLTPEEVALIQSKRERESEQAKRDKERQMILLETLRNLENGLSTAWVRWYASNIIARKNSVDLDFVFGGQFEGEIFAHVDGTFDAKVKERHSYREAGFSKTSSTSPTEAFRKALRNSMKKEEWEGLQRLCDWVLSVEDKPVQE